MIKTQQLLLIKSLLKRMGACLNAGREGIWSFFTGRGSHSVGTATEKALHLISAYCISNGDGTLPYF